MGETYVKILQKEHFVLTEIMILKVSEATPFSSSAISVSRTNKAKKYYAHCPKTKSFIWRSILTETSVTCNVKIICLGKYSRSLLGNDRYLKEQKAGFKINRTTTFLQKRYLFFYVAIRNVYSLPCGIKVYWPLKDFHLQFSRYQKFSCISPLQMNISFMSHLPQAIYV